MSAEEQQFTSEISFTYRTASGRSGPRRILPLATAPLDLVTGIDMTTGLVRTFQLARMGSIATPKTAEELPARAYFDACGEQIRTNLAETRRGRDIALNLWKDMISPLSLLIAAGATNKSETLSPTQVDIAMEYAARESRFGVLAGDFMPGEKRDAWPILRDMIARARPRADHLRFFRHTVSSDWENPRRSRALKEAITEIERARRRRQHT
ncbi:hypothetical protein FHY55_19375 [Oceanicola sp. D3]|uniref:hypothetical protein n=1 Tax=Oceanicola sp. D3 TaxID=2587163 RepID=UPI00111EEBCF|nr:hypothetical protein [Oceanicola sp. D3]QDC11260.1 hypothetical protein FHY55_19375 [Oceanicola sp. D3]